MRWLLCAGAWVLANFAGLYVAAQTKWGPVVLRLSARHGVHLGDLAAVLVGVAVASAVTALMWTSTPAPPATPDVVRWVACAAVWQVSMVAALFLAATTDWGPVIVRLGNRSPVHLGDLFIVLAGVVAAATFTGVVWATASTQSASPVAPPPPSVLAGVPASTGNVA